MREDPRPPEAAGTSRCFSILARCFDRCLSRALQEEWPGDPYSEMGPPEMTTASEDTEARGEEERTPPPREAGGSDEEFWQCQLKCDNQFAACMERELQRRTGNRISEQAARVLARGFALSFRAAVDNLRHELQTMRDTRQPQKRPPV